MIQKPKFKDCFSIEILESDHIVLMREDSHKVLTGKAYKKLAPWLNGQHTVIDLAERLQGELSLPMIQFTLNKLESQGCITEANGSPSARTAFLYALGTNAGSSIDQLRQARVSITALGDTDSTAFRNALKAEEIDLVDEDSKLQVVLVDDYLQEDLEKINAAALAAGRSWIPVKLGGRQSWFGPIFKPGQTACWECLAQRLRTNRQVESFVLRKGGKKGPLKTSLARMPSTINTAVHLAVTEIVKFIVQGQNPRLENQLLTYDHIEMKLEHHTVVQRPQCPSCGDPLQFANSQPIVLQEEKLKSINSGLRSCSPETTFKRFKHHISPFTGVVTGLNDMTTDQDDLMYIYAAGHYFPLVVDSVYWLRQNIRSHSGGKGATRIQSKVSAIGEAIERYSSVYWGYEGQIHGRYRDLQDQAIHPNTMMGYSDEQYLNRERLNKEQPQGSYQIIPNRFAENQEVGWTPVWSLTDHTSKYVFSPLCYYGHPDERFFYNTIDSNGVAAGNSLEEALLQGFLELVERDCVGLWWYNRVQRPQVDLDTFNIPYLQSLRQRYHALGRDIWVLDITSDLGIPAFAALSRWVNAPTEDIIYGFSAHLNPETALIQAVTEMNQCLPAVRYNIEGKGNYRWPDGEAVIWWQNATVSNQPYLLPDLGLGTKASTDYRDFSSGSIKAMVERCVDVVQNAGMEMLALDMTRPDIGMSVCRVIVPGMRHFWRRLGPGRLYDLPVKMGWLEEPIAEENMNSYAIFF